LPGAPTSIPMTRNLIRALRSNCCWPSGRFSSSTNIKSPERFVFDHQIGDRNRLRNRRFGKLSRPFAEDFIPAHAASELFKDDPHHDPRPLERWLAAANLRICDYMPSKLNSAVVSVCFRLHTDATQYAPDALPLQAVACLDLCVLLLIKERTNSQPFRF